MSRPSPLDNPENARHAWARFRRIMHHMSWVSLLVVVLALGALYWLHGALTIHFYIATALGVALTMMLASALMGLVFLSNGSGHDEAVTDRTNGHTGE